MSTIPQGGVAAVAADSSSQRAEQINATRPKGSSPVSYNPNTGQIEPHPIVTTEQQNKEQAIAEQKAEGTYQTPGGVENSAIKSIQSAKDNLGITYVSGGGGGEKSGGLSERDMYVANILNEYSKGFISGPPQNYGNSKEQRLSDLLGQVGLSYNQQTKTITDPLMEKINAGDIGGGDIGVNSSWTYHQTVSPIEAFTSAENAKKLANPNYKPLSATKQTVTPYQNELSGLTLNPDKGVVTKKSEGLGSSLGQEATGYVKKDSSGNVIPQYSSEQVASLISSKITNKEYNGDTSFLAGNINTENSTGPEKMGEAKTLVKPTDLSSTQPSESNPFVISGGHVLPAGLVYVPSQEAIDKANMARTQVQALKEHEVFDKSVQDIITNARIQTAGGALDIFENITNAKSVFPSHENNNGPLSLGTIGVQATKPKLIASISTRSPNAKTELENILSQNQGKDITLAFIPVTSGNISGNDIWAKLTGTAEEANALVAKPKQESVKLGFGVNLPIPTDITYHTKNAFETAKADVLGFMATVGSGYESAFKSDNPLLNFILVPPRLVISSIAGMASLISKGLPFTSGVIEPVLAAIPKEAKSIPLTESAQAFMQENTQPSALSSYMANEPYTPPGFFYKGGGVLGAAGSIAGDVALNLAAGHVIGKGVNQLSYYGVKLGAEVGLPENVLRAGAAALNPIAALQERGLLPRYEEVAYPIRKGEAPSPAFGVPIENTWFYKGLTIVKYGLIGFTKQGSDVNVPEGIGGNIKFSIGKNGLTRYNVVRGETSVLTVGTPTTSLTQDIIATGKEGTPLSEGSQFGSNMFIKNILKGSYKLSEPTTYEQKLTATENSSSSLLTPGQAISTSEVSPTVLLEIPQTPSDLVFNNQLFGKNTMKIGESPTQNYRTIYPNAPFNMDEMQVDRLLTLVEVAKSGKGVKPEVVRKLPDVMFKHLNANQQEALLKVISKYQKPFAFGVKGIKSGDYSLGVIKGSTSQTPQVLEEWQRIAGDIEALPLNSKELMHKFLTESVEALNKNAEPNQLFQMDINKVFNSKAERSTVEKILGLYKKGKTEFKGKGNIELRTGGVLVKPELEESLTSTSNIESNLKSSSYIGGTKEKIFEFAGGKDENGKYISTSGYVFGERTPEGSITAKTEAGTKIKVSVLRKQELRKIAATSSLMSERLAGQSRNITVEEFNRISGIKGNEQGIFPIPHRAKDVGDTLGTSFSNADKLFRQGKEKQAIYKASITEHMKEAFPTYDFETMFSKKPGSLEYHMKNIKPDLSDVMNIGKSKLEEPTGIFRPSVPVFTKEPRIEADYSFEPKASESLLRFTQKPNQVPFSTTLQSSIKQSEQKQPSSIKSVNPRPPSFSSNIAYTKPASYVQPQVRPPSVKSSQPSLISRPPNINSKSITFESKYNIPLTETPPSFVPSKTSTYIAPTPPISNSNIPSILLSSIGNPIGKKTNQGVMTDLATKPDERKLLKKTKRFNYIGNSTESTLVGLYNRQETIYGKVTTAKLSHKDYLRTTKGLPKLVNTKTTGLITTKKTFIGRKETKTKNGVPKF